MKAITCVVVQQTILRSKYTIDSDEIRIDQIRYWQVLFDNRLKKLYRLLLGGKDVGIGVVKEKAGTQPHAVETFQMHPLADKSLVELLRAWMAQQALGLFQQDRFIEQRPIHRDPYQFFVGWPTPEKRSQSVGKADRIQRASHVLFTDIRIHQVEETR